MNHITRSFRLLGCVVLAGALVGCASAADESVPASGEVAATQDQALKTASAPVEDVASDAGTADCDAAAATDPGSYQELESILESPSAALDNDGLALGNTCTRVCACCKRGNRFCCAHCKFCSGPIGPYGVLAQ